MRSAKGLLPIVLAATALAAWAGRPHEHGVARLDVAVQAGAVELNLELALEDLVGFERAPRTDAERAAMAAALERLRAPGELFRIDGAARCTPGRVELFAPAWQLAPPGAPASEAPKDGHADLEGRFHFICKGQARPGFIEVGLFDAFARLQRIDVQAVTGRGQMRALLRRPQGRLALTR